MASGRTRNSAGSFSIAVRRSRPRLGRTSGTSGLVTELSQHTGYSATADIAKLPVKTGQPIREIVRERKLLDDRLLDQILSADAMTSPGVPGRKRTRTQNARPAKKSRSKKR